MSMNNTNDRIENYYEQQTYQTIEKARVFCTKNQNLRIYQN